MGCYIRHFVEYRNRFLCQFRIHTNSIMALLYNLIGLTDEVIETHKSMLIDRVSSKDVQNDILEVLGGIDNILASALQQNLLTEDQLVKLKAIFDKKSRMDAPDLNEMDSMLDEIDAAEKKPALGQFQSPINIISCCNYKSRMLLPVTQLMKDKDAIASPLKFNYPGLVEGCSIMNNGYTVQINIPSDAKCMLSIKGRTYKLVQFHFHTPSEHTVDAKQYDMEMHLVHANEKGELAVLGFIFGVNEKYQRPKLELTQSRAHLVLSKESMVMDTENAMKSIPDEESDDLDTDDEWDGADEAKIIKLGNKRGNDFLAQFFDQLPAQKTDCDIILKKPLSFDYLFETSSKKFSKNLKTNEIDIEMDLFEYDGSLTTPPYSEGVQWLIPTNIQFMSTVQLKDLSACWNNKNNARPVQDYCKRIVQVRSKSSMQVV